MILRLLLIISLCFFSAIGVAVAKEESNAVATNEANPYSIFNGLNASNATPSSFSVVNHDLAVLYVNNNKLRFRTKDYKSLIDEGAGYSPRNIWLIVKGKYVYALWWVKYVFEVKDGKQEIIKGKSLFVRASDDYGKTFSPKVRINSDNGILPDINIVADEQGHISVIYNDERTPRYEVYINSSLDGGKTWLKEDYRLDKVPGQEVKQLASYAGTPHLVRIKDKLIAVWQQFDPNKESKDKKPMTRILARQSDDFGITWNDEEVVFQHEGDVSSTLDVVPADDEIYVFWLNRRKYGLDLFSRKIDSKKWFATEKIAPGTSTNFAISWLRGVADEDNVYITFTYEKNPIKDYVASIKYNRKKQEWYPEVHRLDRHPKKLKYIAKSMDADIAMLPNKKVLTVWEDYDRILPGANVDILDTKTQQWLKNKIRITDTGKMDVRTPKIYFDDKNLWVVFYLNRLVEGRPPYTELAAVKYLLNNESDMGIKSYESIPPAVEVSKKMIRSKVETLWNARLEHNKEKEWPIYDPVFRSKFNRIKWIKDKASIKFDSFAISSIVIKEQYARVKGLTTYQLPKEKMINSVLDPEDKKPKILKADKPIKSTFNMKFGWFGDDWYFIPEMMFMNHLDD